MLFSLYMQKKLILLFILYLYITVVSLLLYDGPDEALLYFVLTTPVWRSGQRAGLIILRSGVRITSPVFTRFIGSFAWFTEPSRQGLVTLNKHPCYRCGAEASAQGS
jgi:hypothetical protein